MNIVHITSVHPRYDTRIYVKMCVSLAQNGHNVYLVVADGKGNEIKDDVNIIDAGQIFASRLLRMSRTANSVYSIASNLNADIYHVHDPELLPFAQFLKLRGKVVIFDMHENLPKAMLTKTWICPLIRSFLSPLVRYAEFLLLHKINIVFAETSYKKDYLWVGCCVDILNFPVLESVPCANDKKNDTFTIGYIGGVSPVRGSVITLDALNILSNLGYDISWECVGPVDRFHRHELVSMVEKYNISGVNFYGYLPLQEGLDLIARCHVGLAVVKPIPNYIESYSTKIFEYMAMGLPVVVSDFPLYKRIINHYNCGLCVDPDDKEQLATALLFLLQNPNVALEMGLRGRKAVEKEFNWNTEFHKLDRFYRELVAG